MKRILIKGFYGRNNMGDDLMLETIVSFIRNIDSNIDIHVFSAQKDMIQHKFRVVVPDFAITGKKITINNIIHRVANVPKYDVLLFGGGTILQDYHGMWHLAEMAAMTILAKTKQTNVALLGIGAGGLSKSIPRSLVNLIIRNCDLCTVRDSQSYELLIKNLQKPISNIFLTEDLVFANTRCMNLIQRLNKKNKQTRASSGLDIAISILPVFSAVYRDDKRQRKFEEVLAALFDEVIMHTRCNLVFIPMKTCISPGDRDDTVMARNVITRMKNKRHVSYLAGDSTLEDRLEALSQSNLAIGMRLHFNLLAALLGVPMIALNYNPKVGSFMESFGQSEYVIDIDHISLQNLPQVAEKRLAVGLTWNPDLLLATREIKALENFEKLKELLV